MRYLARTIVYLWRGQHEDGRERIVTIKGAIRYALASRRGWDATVNPSGDVYLFHQDD